MDFDSMLYEFESRHPCQFQRGFMETKKTLQEALAEANSLIDKIKKALEGIFKDRKRPVPA